MCEYCGCQQIAVIGELTREHEAVVALISRVRELLAADDVDGAAAVTRQMAVVLAPHTVVEEDGLFPELAAEFPDHVETLRAEHRTVEAVLDEASRGTPTDPTWPARLSDALHLLRDHILKEQDGVFPAALASLDADQWERIEVVRERAGSPLAAPVSNS
jgi:hemerythrin-like domain-containing protein